MGQANSELIQHINGRATPESVSKHSNSIPPGSMGRQNGTLHWLGNSPEQLQMARTQGCCSLEVPRTHFSGQAPPIPKPELFSQPPGAALTFHRGRQGGNARLRVAVVHLLVQIAQGVEGRVCVLLYKQVPGVDLIDYNHLHHDAIGEHQLQRRQRRNRPIGCSGGALGLVGVSSSLT